MKRNLNFVALAVLSAAAGSAVAAGMPKEGNFDYTACWTTVMNAIAYSKGNTAFSFELTGTQLSNPPGGPFDKESFRCVGSNAVFGKKVWANATCEAVDRDGDKRLSYFYRGADGQVVREIIAGTGKFDGIVMNEKITPLGPYPAIKPGIVVNCNRHVGTYKMK